MIIFRNLLMTVLLLNVSGVALAETVTFNGQAFSKKDKKKLIYNEAHTVSYDNEQILKSKTVYTNSAGETIAQLICSYSKHRFLPEFEFTDFRSGYWEKMTYVSDGIQVEYKSDKNSKAQSKFFANKKNYSASQGLNQLIVANLDGLNTGEEVVTQFLLPSRMTTVGMLIGGKPLKNERVKVSIKVNNIFLRLFAPKLELIYGKKGSRLLAYHGNSNLMTTKGENQKVYIEYTYPNAESVALNEK